MRLTLRPKENTQTFQKITRGRQWVGRVVQCADGTFLATIGKSIMVRNKPTAEAAFNQACAEFFGFANVNELEAHNSRVAYENKVRRQEIQHMIDEFTNGKDPLAALFTKREK